MIIRRTLEERFYEMTAFIPFHSCWEWIGPKMKQGYGVISAGGRGGKVLGAHRASFEIHKGEIPLGLCVCHRCDNPGCVNPEHLFLATQLENIQDMKIKGRRKGVRHALAKFTESQVLEIRRSYKPYEHGYKKLALEYGTIPQHIFDIVSRKIWKHI